MIEEGLEEDGRGVEADVEGVYPPLDEWYFPGVDMGIDHEMVLVEETEVLEGLEANEELTCCPHPWNLYDLIDCPFLV